jgi:hypothetical protein
MSVKSRKSIALGVATGVIALALSGLPLSLDIDAGAIDGKAAVADPGGNGKGKGNGNGKGQGVEKSQQAKAHPDKTKVAKDDPMHPSNLGRLNGFLHASPQALKNASANSAIGTLSKTYRDALLGYATSTEETEETISTDDLAAILAKAANKPLTGEQVLAIHEKLIAENPELAAAAAPDESTETPESDEDSETVDLMDPDFADQLADDANVIQATETNQGLGSGDDADDDDTGDVADGDDDAEDGGVVADAADAVGQAAEDTAEAIGDFFDDTF